VEPLLYQRADKQTVKIEVGSILRAKKPGRWRVFVDKIEPTPSHIRPGDEWTPRVIYFYTLVSTPGAISISSDYYHTANQAVEPSGVLDWQSIISWAGGKKGMVLETDPEFISQICETLKKGWHTNKVPEIFIEQLRKAGLPI